MQTICCFTFAFVLWVAVEFTPGIFVAVFTNDPRLARMTERALRIYMASVLLMGIQISCQQSFIVLKNSRIRAFLADAIAVFTTVTLFYREFKGLTKNEAES